MDALSTKTHLVWFATPSLVPIVEGTQGRESISVEFFQFCKVEQSFQIARLLLPLLQFGFKLLFLSDESDGIDTFVHTDGVLPVVGAVGIFRVVLDAHSFVGTHVAEHDFLFYGTSLSHNSIHSIAAFLDTIAAQVAAGAAGISHNHGKIAGFIAIH